MKIIYVGVSNLMCETLLNKPITENTDIKAKTAESLHRQTDSVKKKINPQAIYAKNLLEWNALLITLAKQTEELQKAEEQIHAEKAHAYLINLLDKKQNKLLETTQQLGLKREKARIEKQYKPIAPSLDKSASHEAGEEETEQQNPSETSPQNPSKKSNNLNALNLDNARDILVETNWMRLYLLRINRLFSTISLVAHNAKLNEILKSANSVLHPIFNILSWAYYLPRLTINLAMLVKHTVPNHWMDDQEKKLSFSERLKAQWDRRWSALLNDGVWCAVGITTCFFLTGPNAMLLIVALYIFDVINISAKAYVDIRRYNRLIQETESKITKLKLKQQAESKEDIQSLNAKIDIQKKFITNLKTLKKQQCKSSALNVGTAVGLLGGMILFIPALAACPVIPVIGASMVMATCIIYIVLKKVFIHSPEVLVPQNLNPYSFLAEQNNNIDIPNALQNTATP